ncbi:MAG: PASTA domain-containing protein [Bacteroidia bacterium]|nr:PASTA domain-containing protein [Bacteroidia bacterium]
MTVKEFFSIKTNKFFWVNIAAMGMVVIVLLFITLKAIDVYTRHGEGVVVPDVKGMSVEEATMMFRNHGLTCVVSDSTYVKNKPAGIILELTPAAGQKVKEGRMIYLTLNALKVPLRQVPDVADNSSFREAEARILAAGFKLGVPQIVSGEQDWVYGLKYNGRQLSAGDKVPAGATLVLMVGDGTGEHVEGDSLDTDSVVGTEPVSAEAPTEESWF